MKPGLIIYSGGMDSTCLLFEFRNRIELAITFDYGSKHNEREYIYALKNTHQLGIEHTRINIAEVLKDFNSDLLKSGGEIPEGHYEHESMKRTVVPFRNGIMLSIAAGIADSRGLKEMYIANHAGDHAIYPDCRPEFIKAMNMAIVTGCQGDVCLKAPYTKLSKRQIALRGADAGVSFDSTYSCYKGGRIHCGKCGTCVERKEALAGFDPTTYLG